MGSTNGLAIAIPTLSCADLLHTNWDGFVHLLGSDDRLVILDNGCQSIRLRHPKVLLYRVSMGNLGVAGSWNWFLRYAFIDNHFSGLVLAQDDIRWESLNDAKRLLMERPDVDLFLSNFNFSIQVHRPSNLKRIGWYDEGFFPCWCEDDDYALRAHAMGAVYERFQSLDPLGGSISGGTSLMISPCGWNESPQRRRAD